MGNVYRTEDGCPGCPKTKYDVIVVGGGAGGITSTYLPDLYSRITGENNNLKILLLEARGELGGDAQSKVSNQLNASMVALTKSLYNYTGPFVYDLGPQRIPQLTLRLQRSLGVDTQTLLEGMPYSTYQDSRGRLAKCPDPQFADYSCQDPYGMASACTSTFPYIGDNSVPWQYNNWIGPAFNLTKVQPWAYQEDGGLTAANIYMIYGGPNPVTCDDPNKSCEECGDCFADTCSNYLNLYAALYGQLGHELAELFTFDYAGFYADMMIGLHDPCDWAKSYWLREWDTNTNNFYVVGGFKKYLLNLAKPIIQNGDVILNSRVKKIDYDGELFYAYTSQNTYVSKFLIYAAPPEELRTMSGNVPLKLMQQPELNSVYSVSVVTIHATSEQEYLPPTPDWTLLRSFGTQGCIPRLEYRNSPYGAATQTVRVSYTDYLCEEIFDDIVKLVEQDDAVTEKRLWNQLQHDLAYIFQIPIESIPEDVELSATEFKTAWYYISSDSQYDEDEIKAWSAAPLGSDIPLCLAHEAWDYKYLGWAEASMRTAQQCVDRILPGSSDTFECWMEQLFPPDDECYSNPDADILGSETIVPSPYCNERWWINDFEETDGCVSGRVTSPIPECTSSRNVIRA